MALENQNKAAELRFVVRSKFINLIMQRKPKDGETSFSTFEEAKSFVVSLREADVRRTETAHKCALSQLQRARVMKPKPAAIDVAKEE